MKEWIGTVMSDRKRSAVPIMTHPGIDLVGSRIVDAVRDGEAHAGAIVALNEKYPSAAPTAIMDLTVEAEAFGAPIRFEEHDVPSVTGRLVCDRAGVEALPVPTLDAGRVPEYLKANALTAARITDKPVFAGCIGPFSLAGRLFDMTEIMMAIYTEPDTVHLLLGKCTAFLKRYVEAIRKSGVNGVIIAEPAAGLLPNADAIEFSSRYLRGLIDDIQDDCFAVVVHNCGNSGHATESMIETGARGLHFGNKIDMAEALRQTPSDLLVMGNLNPVGVLKQMDAAGVKAKTAELLERTRQFPNFIISSGCDVPPGVPVENIVAFYEAVSEYNAEYM